MNMIEELIQKECPEGVEYLPLDVLGVFYSGLSGKSKNDFVDGNAKFITYMNVYSHPSLKLDVEDKVKINEGEKQNLIEKGDILFTGSSETPDECGMSSVVTDEIIEPTYLNSFCFGFRLFDKAKYDFGYLKHLFRSRDVRALIAKTANGVTRYNVSKKLFAKIEIPVPPLSVQHKIVEILDKFTSLEAELQAELEARKKQYEYYRNQLLDFTGREDVEWKTLGEISYYPKERIPSEELNENNYVSVENLLSNKQGKTISSSVPKSGGAIKYIPNDILIGNIRPYLRKIWMADIIGGTNGDVVIVRIKDDFKNSIIPQYLYCLLSSEDFFNYDNSFAKGGKMPRGDKKQILKYPIPIPPLTEQQRIVTILDKFEALINDQTASLAAEMKARHQQYEYYRDKLLTFQRKEA